MNTIQIKPGDFKSATLAVTSFLVSEHKFPKGKAAEKAVDIMKKAKLQNPNFDGAFITKFTEEELKMSVSKATAAKKEPVPKAELSPAQMKIAGNPKLTLNERARELLTDTGFTKITAIAKALGVSFQRVTNVRKNMQKGATEKAAKPVATPKPAKAAAAKAPAKAKAPAATAEPKQKRKYTKRAK